MFGSSAIGVSVVQRWFAGQPVLEMLSVCVVPFGWSWKPLQLWLGGEGWKHS